MEHGAKIILNLKHGAKTYLEHGIKNDLKLNKNFTLLYQPIHTVIVKQTIRLKGAFTVLVHIYIIDVLISEI